MASLGYYGAVFHECVKRKEVSERAKVPRDNPVRFLSQTIL